VREPLIQTAQALVESEGRRETLLVVELGSLQKSLLVVELAMLKQEMCVELETTDALALEDRALSEMLKARAGSSRHVE
jgi:hypothetical protein